MRQTVAPIIGITCVTFLLLFPYWTIQGVFWDGWIYHSTLIFGNSDALFTEFRNNGRIYSAYLIHLLSEVSHPSWTGILISSIAIALSSGFFFSTIRWIGLFPKRLAVLCALLGGVFPAFQVSLSLSALNFFVVMPVFYAALYVSLIASEKKGAKQHQMKVIAAIMFLISFTAEATIVLCWWTFFFSTLHFRKKGLALLEAAKKSLITNFWIIPLSLFGYWLMMFVFIPDLGSGYAGSKTIDLTNLKNFIDYISVLVTWNVNALAFLIIGYLIKICMRQKPNHNQFDILTTFVGIFGVILAVLPFLIGGRQPAIEGWETRYLMYAAFPFSIVLVSVIEPLSSWDTNIRLQKVFQFFLVTSFLCLSHVGVSWAHALDWQLRWARDKAIITYLATEARSDVGLIIIDDEPNSRPEIYRLYELVGLVKTALNRPTVTATQGSRVSGLSTSTNVKDHLPFDSQYFDPINRNRHHIFSSYCQKIMINDGHLSSLSALEKAVRLHMAWDSNQRSMFEELTLSISDC